MNVTFKFYRVHRKCLHFHNIIGTLSVFFVINVRIIIKILYDFDDYYFYCLYYTISLIWCFMNTVRICITVVS